MKADLKVQGLMDEYQTCLSQIEVLSLAQTQETNEFAKKALSRTMKEVVGALEATTHELLNALSDSLAA